MVDFFKIDIIKKTYMNQRFLCHCKGILWFNVNEIKRMFLLVFLYKVMYNKKVKIKVKYAR